MQRISIIGASTRPARYGTQIVQWIQGLLEAGARATGDTEIRLVDLAEVDLPFFDEEVPPQFDKYQNAHTLAWAKTIDESDGFVFVTPEYNHSFNAPLKNAIDYLYKEWNHKPVSFVCYGGHAGGTRAAEHLRAVVGEMKMFDLRDMVLVPFGWQSKDAQGRFLPNEHQVKSAAILVDQIIFWTREMKASRLKLRAR